MNRMARKLGWMALGVALAVPLAALAEASAQAPAPGGCPCGQRAGRGHGHGAHAGRMFDPSAVTTVQGDVVEVATGQGPRAEGVHLTLAVGSENLAVMVGPGSWLDQQPVKLAKGDRLEVKGARTAFGGQPVLVAQEIRKGDQVLTLRDASGLPAWRGACSR